MLVLALDTATPAVTAGVVELTTAPSDPPTVRATRIAHDARKHAELLMPGVLAACAEAGVALTDLDAIVTGTGPGPFTGLRVGMVTAAALGDALDVPVHGVCSLDAIAVEAVEAPVTGNLLVLIDARRREVYWAAYDDQARRFDGPHVETPAALAARLPELGVGATAGGAAEVHAGLLGRPVLSPAAPSPAALVAVAADVLRSGAAPEPLQPLYLRRPDAVEPGARKRVSTG
ncbi:tRNA (adenosine(37)-N6)-threonylcarbamoyltransferase complex dimerization subunit type 1 TsaB [Pseudonocardia bannensis]|uniref:tRNA (Adenosine(37)-N6)-threonylcarbamoyltransferase complex dimerization subunit type 1 TsaB n=1 Tax=Pseudonocardia bannensis TaxID=630973 RepID=A0A848DMV0_9PSEU|nr:tRNA (adenosine(37)-N6)-threonylcarbamoyltransferase complex dimerization subunit type 1 TsaB [Pseudonocardia bannensis]NMH93859.1 tRNA (adenosine(37)-N6)-threonylcarbamoyltransferase complex dimerization subunit type 1 TsaB [Pseudonocardia bannensis]